VQPASRNDSEFILRARHERKRAKTCVAERTGIAEPAPAAPDCAGSAHGDHEGSTAELDAPGASQMPGTLQAQEQPPRSGSSRCWLRTKAASRVLAAMPARRRMQVSTGRTVAGLANRHKQATVRGGATPLPPGARWALPVHAPHELEGDTGAQVRRARSALSVRSSSITTGRPTSRARAGPPLALTGPLTVPSAVTTCHAL
jgi:hypothetical protein